MGNQMENKLRWFKDGNDWHGSLWPQFCIASGRKKLELNILDARRKGKNRSRFIAIESVKQGEQIAAELIKTELALGNEVKNEKT
jgi:hypothetical protein